MAPRKRTAITTASNPGEWSSQKEPAKPLHPPRVSINYEWTAERIRNAFTSADQGRFEGLGDLTETVIAHPDVAGALAIRSGALTARTLAAKGDADQVRALRGYYNLSGDSKPKPTAENELSDEWIAGDIEIMMPAAEMDRLRAYGLLPRIAVIEFCTHYAVERGRQINVGKVWNLRHFEKNLQTGQWYVRVATTPGGAGSRKEPITFGDGQWYLYTPAGTDRPWSSSPLFGLADWWKLGGPDAANDWGVASERSGKGLISIESEASIAGYNEGKANAVGQRVYDAGKYGVVALPPGVRLNALEFDPSTWEIFQAQVKAFREFVSITMLGGDLAFNASQGGSYAAALAQDPHFQHLVTGEAALLSGFLSDGPIRDWWRLNYGIGRPPRIFWSVPENEEARRKAQAELDATEAEAASKRLSLVKQALDLAPESIDVRATLEGMQISGLVLIDFADIAAPDVPAGPGGYPVPIGAQRAAARGRLLTGKVPEVSTGVPAIGPRDTDRRIASTLALGTPVDRRFVSVLDSWFDMNAAAKESDTGTDAEPTELYVRWLLHGGDAGRTWSTDVMEGRIGLPEAVTV